MGGYGRSGIYVPVPLAGGYRAFRPKPLPPDPPITHDAEMIRLLTEAARALGLLEGRTQILPDADYFVYMYIRQEAVLSSQIEGTQASLMDVLEFESDMASGRRIEIAEVVNYVAAMNAGLDLLRGGLPVSLRLIRMIHATLLHSGRGSSQRPGEFRTEQNWIGALGAPIRDASFVPPTVADMHEAMGALEAYLHRGDDHPLIKLGLTHAQFETIHPFRDGNGRIGRLLVTFLLCEAEILSKPLLYLSVYLKQHRQEYYTHLQRIREEGDWESWLKFFLRGVAEVAADAAAMAERIVRLREALHVEVRQICGQSAAAGEVLLDGLFSSPVISVGDAVRITGLSYPAANGLVARLRTAGVLREMTGASRNRRFAFDKYIRLFAPTSPDSNAS